MRVRVLGVMAAAVIGAGGAVPEARAQEAAAVGGDGGALFEMRSGFWINLHHFLYVLARARAGQDADRAAVTASLADTAGLGALGAQERRAWEGALEHYGRALAGRNAVFDREMVAITTRLAELGDAGRPAGA